MSNIMSIIERNYNTIKFWIRSDDICLSDQNFVDIIKLYSKYDVEVVLCVIPSIVDQKCAEFVNDRQFVVSQHGYSHKNYSNNIKCELSDIRDQQELLDQMLKGKQKIEQIFKKDVNILSPPYSTIEIKTQKLLRDYYSTLSMFGDYKSMFLFDKNPFVDIINWNTNTFGGEDFCNSQIIRALSKTNNIGICIHSNFLNDEGYYYLERLFEKLSNSEKTSIRRKKL